MHPHPPTDRPTVLVLGATGQTGRLVVEELIRQPGAAHLRVAARKEADLARFRAAGIEAVRVDLDAPSPLVRPWPAQRGCFCLPALLSAYWYTTTPSWIPPAVVRARP